MWLRNRQGTEPVTARSPLRVRRIMSLVALAFGLVAGVFFVVLAVRTGEEVWRWEAAIAAAVVVIAVIDLLVLRRRSRAQRDD
ncbi:hypothetical protein GCM10022224_062050 [Nonomuraea antimicrobica]|uniref:Uncharacterized protein n=1 Tax=Nonomuraea antimicrobica TaxID=561173 RepID=A0ABP7CDU4_9ACTN